MDGKLYFTYRIVKTCDIENQIITNIDVESGRLGSLSVEEFTS